MPYYPLFGVSQTGKSPHVTAQERINVYAEPRQGDRTQLAFYGTPGLSLFADLGDEPFRGLHAVGSTLYGVHRGTFYSIDNTGSATNKGTLSTTSGRVDMANNGLEVIVVDGANGYIYNIAGDTFTAISDVDFPGGDTVAFQGGRFIVNEPDTGNYYWSAQDDGTSWGALDFANAEGFPDDLMAVFVDRSEVMLFGQQSMEFHAEIENSDSPYVRIQGGSVEVGLAAQRSIAKFGTSIIFLAKNRLGEALFVRLDGYTPVPISNPDLDFIINNYSDVSTATAFSYRVAGHSFYQCTFPGEDKTWLYDGSTNLWSSLESGTQGERHLAEIGTEFLNSIVVSDYNLGRLYRMDPNIYGDNGAQVARQLTARHIFEEENITVSRLWIDMETGTGTTTGQGEDPRAMLQVSKDGGQTWGPERWAPIGKIGKYKTRAIWRRLGVAKEWTFRLRVSDPVKFAISGAWIDVPQTGLTR